MMIYDYIEGVFVFTCKLKKENYYYYQGEIREK